MDAKSIDLPIRTVILMAARKIYNGENEMNFVFNLKGPNCIFPSMQKNQGTLKSMDRWKGNVARLTNL